MVKKYINLSLIYAIIGILLGAFYREFTKFLNYSGPTKLSLVHTHVLVLGMVFFLLAAFAEKIFTFSDCKSGKMFFYFYNIGFVLTILGFLTRGVLTVFGTNLSSGLNASISGMAGIGHILLSVGIILFFVAIKKKESSIDN